MSSTAAQQFVDQVKKDAALQKQLSAAGNDVSAILKIAAAAGFVFTADEYKAAFSGDWTQEDEQLSENELDSVAGGGGGTKSAAGACYTLGSGPDCNP